MEKITTIGLDLAKSVFQVHAIAKDGRVVIRRAFRRSQSKKKNRITSRAWPRDHPRPAFDHSAAESRRKAVPRIGAGSTTLDPRVQAPEARPDGKSSKSESSWIEPGVANPLS